ncbi:MAG: 2-oxo acid dehydrogenase subunit E2 [Armatimonadota bacterium]
MPRKKHEPEFVLRELTPTRRAIAERVSQSSREIPVFHMHILVDASALVRARDTLKQEHGRDAPTYNDLLLKCVAGVLPDHPTFNAWYEDDALKVCKQVNLGFAVATDEGVLMPTLFDADQKSLLDIAAETRQLAAAAREGKLRASLQMGATFSISNVGPVGIDAFSAVISPPQTGILAVGSIIQRTVIGDRHSVVTPTCWLTLSVDHRAADGMHAARFLRDLADAIQAFRL